MIRSVLMLLAITAACEARSALEPYQPETSAFNHAVPCLADKQTTTLSDGDSVAFTSPNYSDDYDKNSDCGWTFKTSDKSNLFLKCDSVKLRRDTELAVIDGDSYTIAQACKKLWLITVCPETTFKYDFNSTTGTVSFKSKRRTAAGFSCVITAKSDCKCGGSNPAGVRIIGGIETAEHGYPWMVALVPSGSDSNFCGGTIISDEFILTAAHCVVGSRESEIQVRLGEHDLTTTTSNRNDVLQIIVHPDFTGFLDGNDVALLRIAPISLSATNKIIAPVCLPQRTGDYAGEDAITIGWGLTSPGGALSDKLLEVDVPVISNADCNSSPAWPVYSGLIIPSMICVGGEPGKSVCNGDSGGPVVYENPAGFHEQIGVTSFGTLGCNQGPFVDYPSVFARVTAVQSWVESHITGTKICPPGP